MSRSIATPAEFQAALREMEGIFQAKGGTPEGDRLEVLADLLDTDEQRLFPWEDVHGIL